MDSRLEQLSETQMEALENYYKLWALPTWANPLSRQFQLLRELDTKDWKLATSEEQEILFSLESKLGVEASRQIEQLFHIYHFNRAGIVERKNQQKIDESREKRISQQQEERLLREERQRQAAIEMELYRQEMARKRREQFEAELAEIRRFDEDINQRSIAQSQAEREQEFERRRGFKRGTAVVVKQEPYSGLYGNVSQIFSEGDTLKIKVDFKLLGKPFTIVCDDNEIELNYRSK